ncbi:MAG: hypothetical protein U9Q19_04070 [Pseudomonadota bacterium]|nr:hypothetical protein [Pseudomonadota bacterium]
MFTHPRTSRTSNAGRVTREIMELAEHHARGRVVSTLEGGYQAQALARSVVQHIRALMRLD